MYRRLAISIVMLSAIAAAQQVQAQTRSQEEVAVDLIGGAIGGGLLGVAGVLTRYAIEDAMRQREEARVQVATPVSTARAYAFSDNDRSGVHYNKPCSSFEPASGRLMPCELSTVAPAVYGAGGMVMATRPYSVAKPVVVAYVRPAHGHRGSRVDVRAGRVSAGRAMPAFHGGHR